MNEEVQKFLGLRISTITRLVTYGGRSVEIVEYDSTDESIVALKNICETKEWKLRILMPGSFSTMDFNMNRLNVVISSEDKISYVISEFSWG